MATSFALLLARVCGLNWCLFVSFKLFDLASSRRAYPFVFTSPFPYFPYLRLCDTFNKHFLDLRMDTCFKNFFLAS